MNLQDQGFRYYASPCKTVAKWINPVLMAVFNPDWIDVTDLSAEELFEFFTPELAAC